VAHWIEQYRVTLEGRTGASVPPAAWRAGFVAALNDLLITRLALYALVHRVRPQCFLPRIVSSWLCLHRAARRLAGCAAA
jgi:hypothetical protein